MASSRRHLDRPQEPSIKGGSNIDQDTRGRGPDRKGRAASNRARCKTYSATLAAATADAFTVTVASRIIRERSRMNRAMPTKPSCPNKYFNTFSGGAAAITAKKISSSAQRRSASSSASRAPGSGMRAEQGHQKPTLSRNKTGLRFEAREFDDNHRPDHPASASAAEPGRQLKSRPDY